MSNARNETVMYFSQDGTLTSVRVEDLNSIQWDGSGKIVNLKNKGAALSDVEAKDYSSQLHPTVKEWLEKKSKTASFSLEMLYALKAEKGLVINGGSQGTHIRMYVALGYGNNNGHIRIDALIKSIRRKNKTYAEQEEINQVIQRIKGRFPDSVFTPSKKMILDDFMAFYAQQEKNKVFSRSKIVEDWVNQYIEEHQFNPLESLQQHRRTDFFRIFNSKNPISNPKNLKDTDSIQFFKKFLQGETVSDDLRALFEFPQDKDPEDGVFYQPNSANR